MTGPRTFQRQSEQPIHYLLSPFTQSRATPLNLLAFHLKWCYAQYMVKNLLAFGLVFTVCASGIFPASAASEPCKDCAAPPELSIREQIKAQRAIDADRVAKESSVRPWDGTDIGQAKRANSSPVVR